MERPLLSAHEDERVTILDTIATMTDRAVDGQVRLQIDETRRTFTNQLKQSRSAFDAIAHGLRRSALCLPIKAPVYATLLGLLTANEEPYAKELASSVTDAVSKDLAASVRAGETGPARRALRFLACLADCNVTTSVSIADHILALITTAHFELTSAGRSERGVHCRGPFLAEVALSALPWAGKALHERLPEKLKEIMEQVELVAGAFRPDCWRCVSPSTDLRCVETFAEQLSAILHLKTVNWVCSGGIIPRPQDEFDMQLAGGQELRLPPLSIPSHSKLTRYSCPRFRLCLVNKRPNPSDITVIDVDMKDVSKNEKFAPASHAGHEPDIVHDATVTDLTLGARPPNASSNAKNTAGQATVKGVTADPNPGQAPGSAEVNGRKTSADAMDTSVNGNLSATARANGLAPDTVRSPLVNYVLRCYVGDVIDNFPDNHMMAAERLLNMPMFNNVNDEIVEGVFSHMCSLPLPTYSPVYYGTLFVDLCRVKDSRLPAKLLTAVETMFQEAAEFDPETFDRLTDWFSFHLSNFGYKWNWADWAIYADEDMIEKFPYRALFCKDVLARCVRLSYYERIMKIIPTEMKYFLPPPPGSGDRSRFDEAVNQALMKIVTGRDKQSPEVVENRLKELIPTKSSDEAPELSQKAEETANLARLAALLRSILQAGCKTLSHFDIVSERYEGLLRALSMSGGHPARRLVTLEVTTFWKDVHIRRMYVLDKLRARGVIDGPAIIDSCLAYERIDETGSTDRIPENDITENLGESTIWELIRLVFSRARSREEAARSELEWASQSAASANEGESEKVEAQLQQAKANTEKAKTEIAELLLVALRRLFGILSMLLTTFNVDVDVDFPTDGKRQLPGFSDKPIWYWRCVGMVRELGRKHPRHVPMIIDQLDTDTKDNRDQHRVLWESFEILKEVEGSAMLAKVW